MTLLDFGVLGLYLLGTLSLGLFFYFQNKTCDDMFSAGGQSPWWVSGLSGFMTIFSAATFVVWGGIAYKYGLVAIAINMCYGISALSVGYFVAGRWKEIGVHSPSEYVSLRFGNGAVHLYIWTMMTFRIVGAAVALYGLAILLTALMPVPDGYFFQDSVTGNLSVTWAIIFFGCIVVVYTMAGGLWAVLMTDVIQFIILNLAVIFVIPLILIEVGGLDSFSKNAPDDFFSLVSGEYTWFFLAGWCAIHFFMIGAEWAFAQRFISVRSKKDARKSAYLFGVLYIFSPFVWLAPPLIYRVINPNANPEQAYILASQLVLPAGMLGLMVAAMFSATASAVSSQLNVFAGALTEQVYNRLFRPNSADRELVWAGRGFTVILGCLLISVAVAIPYLGGAEKVVIATSSLVIGPLLAPAVWALFSRKINVSAVWTVAATSFTLGVIVSFGLSEGGFLADIQALATIANWVQNAGSMANLIIGVVIPVLILIVKQYSSTGESIGWKRLAETSKKHVPFHHSAAQETDALPITVVSIALLTSGAMMLVIAWLSSEDRIALILFASVLCLIGGVLISYARRSAQVSSR